MNPTLYHDLNGLLAIMSGKARQAEKLLNISPLDPEKLQMAREKLKTTIETIDRLADRIRLEKENL